MRILHITAKMDPTMGGISQGIRTMIDGLLELGAENEVVTLDEPDASFLKDEEFIINTPGKGKGPWCFNPRLASWLRENLNRFDNVIIHGIWLYHGYAAWKAIRFIKNNNHSIRKGKIKAPKVFVMPHGMLDPYFQLAKGRKLKALRNWFYWKFIEGNIINRSDGMLFTCQKEQQLARKPFSPYFPKEEIVVGLGVDEPPLFIEDMRTKFLEKCPDLGNDSYLLFLSRIHEKKGVDLLIDAYKKMIEKSSLNSIPKLVIAGPGLETFYGKKMQKITLESSALRASVHFPGMLSGNAKWGAFYGCNAFVLPSHQENFGIAVVEAMACSKPALISNQVNICHEIEDYKGGMVENDTLEGTLTLLKNWQSLPCEEKQLMGMRARNCFENKFATSPAAKRVLHALNSSN